MANIEVGKQAPDFNVLDQNRERVFLSKAVTKGKVLLAFYPSDDTPVCTTQLKDYAQHAEEFKKRNIQVYGVSINSIHSHQGFHKKLELPFPLLADYDTRITHKYGVMSFTGHPKRALFLIDEDQKVLYKKVECLAISHRSSEELFKEINEVAPAPAPAAVEESKAEE